MPMSVNNRISNNKIKIFNVLFCTFPIQIVCDYGQILHSPATQWPTLNNRG